MDFILIYLLQYAKGVIFLNNLPLRKEEAENHLDASTIFRFNESILDETRNLTLEHSDDMQFLEIFFHVEIQRNTGKTTLSKHTLKAYRSDAQTLFNFLQTNNLSLKTLGFPEVMAYSRYINTTFAIRTAIRKLQFFRRLLRFGHRSQFYKTDFSTWVDKPKTIKGHYSSSDIEGIENKKPARLRELEQEAAYAIALSFELIVKDIKRNQPYMEFLNKRNLFMGYLLYSTGMRASEITNLDFSHFRNKKGVIYVDVVGKGNKPRKVPMDGENSVKAFENYRDIVVEYLQKHKPKIDIEEAPLLFSPIALVKDRELNRMSYYTLYKIVKQGVAKSVDLVRAFREDASLLNRKEKTVARLLNSILPQPAKDGHISPHWFRHTYVTMLLENDVPLAIVKDLVGHADISTTNLYLEKIQEEKKHEHLSKLGHLGF